MGSTQSELTRNLLNIEEKLAWLASQSAAAEPVSSIQEIRAYERTDDFEEVVADIEFAVSELEAIVPYADPTESVLQIKVFKL